MVTPCSLNAYEVRAAPQSEAPTARLDPLLERQAIALLKSCGVLTKRSQPTIPLLMDAETAA